MASVRDHYDTVLSEYYSRMFGEFDAKVAEQPDGWRFRKGVYRKLRLTPVERHQAPAGMVALVGVSVGQRRS